MVAVKGTTSIDKGYYYCPYVPLQETSQVVEPYRLFGKVYGSDPDGWATFSVRTDVSVWLFETFTEGVDVRWVQVRNDLYISMSEKAYTTMVLRWA